MKNIYMGDVDWYSSKTKHKKGDIKHVHISWDAQLIINKQQFFLLLQIYII